MTTKEISLICIAFVATICFYEAVGVTFDQNYKVSYGGDHLIRLNQGNEVQLKLDKLSGAGFESKVGYASGFFKMRIKLPNNRNTAEIVTTFYMDGLSDGQSAGNPHDELDFEFLGSDKQPYLLQTNVFASDKGGREQRIHLGWFDPTADFHTYGILWNQFQIVFFVDDIPIRVFKNNKRIGVNFPSQGMRIRGSLWDGTPWASGGKPVDWSQAPFIASYEEFDIAGCPFQNTGSQSMCYDPKLWWNGAKFATLDPVQQSALNNIRAKYLVYDYCNTPAAQFHPECRA